jgi:hypothetical protein
MRGSHCLMSLDPVWGRSWTHASGKLSLRITVAQRGVLRRSRPYHRRSIERMAGWCWQIGFRQPICYGVEIIGYRVVSGQSAVSAERIGLELPDGQTVAQVAAFRLWGNWGRCGLVRLARGGGGHEWSCASGARPGAFWST